MSPNGVTIKKLRGDHGAVSHQPATNMYYLIKDIVRGIRTKISLPYLKGKVLDIGCGGADLLPLVGAERYTGVDIELNSGSSGNLIQMDVEDCHQRYKLSEQYNTIVMLAVLEHLKDPTEVLRWCNARMVTGGNLVITTPTVLGDFIISKIFRLKVGHIQIFNRSKLFRLCSLGGYKVILYKKFEIGANQLLVARKL